VVHLCDANAKRSPEEPTSSRITFIFFNKENQVNGITGPIYNGQVANLGSHHCHLLVNFCYFLFDCPSTAITFSCEKFFPLVGGWVRTII
jgi:hypothetical protein